MEENALPTWSVVAVANEQPEVLPDMYRRLHHIDPHQQAQLERAGVLVSPKVDFDEIIARYF